MKKALGLERVWLARVELSHAHLYTCTIENSYGSGQRPKTVHMQYLINVYNVHFMRM